MQFKFYWIFLMCSFVFCSTNAQLKGRIIDAQGNSIENASVKVWNGEDKKELLAYSYSNSSGNFVIEKALELSIIFIEVNALDYQQKSFLITDLKGSIDIILKRSEIILNEVQIRAPIKISNDTVFYNPTKFLDGTEKKVEDLLDKLPGISVNKITGEVKYKGKSVETVQLGGDDLFGNSYALGTQNISVEMIDEVQAIENYSSNKMLKGIEDSDKVILNLKLIKTKTDYSGTFALQNGYLDRSRYADEMTLIGVSSKIKSFGVFKVNNIGRTNGESMKFSEQKSSTVSGENILATPLLNDRTPSVSLPENRAKFNQSLFSNYNIIYKFSSKLALKSNIYYADDKISFQDHTINYYPASDLQTILKNDFIKCSNTIKLDTKTTYDSSKNSQLVFIFNLKNSLSTTNNQVAFNELNPFYVNYTTSNLHVFTATEYTLKLSKNAAIEWVNTFSRYNAPQNFKSTPGNAHITGIDANQNIQKSVMEKTFFASRLHFLFNYKGFKNDFTISYLLSNNPFQSSFVQDNKYLNNFINNQIYKKSKLYISTQNTFKTKKIRYSHNIAIKYYQQQLSNFHDDIKTENDNLIFNYNGYFDYYLNNYKSFYVNINFDQMTPLEEYLFQNNLVADNITLVNSRATLDFAKTTDISFGYKFNRLIKNYSINLGFNYAATSDDYVSNVVVNQNFVGITHFQPSTTAISKGLIFNIERTFKKLKTLAKLNNMLSKNTYFNSLNNFELRENQSDDVSTSLFVSTFFNFPINFENNFSYRWIASKSPSENFNTINAITNNSRFNYKVNEQLLFSLSQDYYLPNNKRNAQFSFLDFTAQYNSEKIKWLNLNFYFRNILNSKTFTQVYTNDYSYQIYKSNLIPRYFLLSMEFKF